MEDVVLNGRFRGGRGSTPPFQTQTYFVYYFEEKRMHNLTLQIFAKLYVKSAFFQNFLLASLAQVLS